MTWRKTPQRLLQLPNRSLNLTPHRNIAGQALPRAEFFVWRRYILSPMLIDSEVALTNSKNVNATAVQNACLPAGRGAARRVDDSSESLTGFRQRRISLRLKLPIVRRRMLLDL